MMMIIRNIGPAIKLYNSLRVLEAYRRGIRTARAAGDDEGERAYALKAMVTWGNNLVRIFKIDLRVEGAEHLPDTGPVVFIANHQGYADIPLCCAALNKFQFGFVAKNNLEKVPLYGGWIRDIRSVWMERDDARASLRAIGEGIELIERGFSLLVFPEGTRSRGGPMKEFKKGSLRLATKPGVPVIPITINGTWRIYEEKGVVRNGMPVDFIIHPPIETAGMGKSEANNLSNEVEELIGATLARLQGADAPQEV